MMRLVVILSICFALGLGTQLPTFYHPLVDATLAEHTPNTAYGLLNNLVVSGRRGESRAMLIMNLDGTSNLFDSTSSGLDQDFVTDCNKWDTPLQVNLILRVINVTGCSSSDPSCQLSLYSITVPSVISDSDATWNCPSDDNTLNLSPNCMTLWDGGNIDNNDNVIDQKLVSNGQTTVVFDITSFAAQMTKPYVYGFAVVMKHSSKGVVNFYSKESGYSTSPTVLVTNPPHPLLQNVPLVDICPRLTIPVQPLNMTSINMSVVICGPSTADTAVVVNHGQPSDSRDWEDFAYTLVQLSGHAVKVILVDWINSGFSQKLSKHQSLEQGLFDGSWISHATYQVKLLQLLNVTTFHSVSFEVGSLPAIYSLQLWEKLHPETVLSIAYPLDNAYLNQYVCPSKYNNGPNNLPPITGFGICQSETLVPYWSAFLGGEFWSSWNSNMYYSASNPDAWNSTCFMPLVRGFYDNGRINYYSGYQAPPQTYIDWLLSVYQNKTSDPYCLTDGLVMFPMHVPLDRNQSVWPNEPLSSAMVIGSINDYVLNNGKPLFHWYADSQTPGSIAPRALVPTAAAVYSKRTYMSINIGCATGHLSSYDHFDVLAQSYWKWLVHLVGNK